MLTSLDIEYIDLANIKNDYNYISDLSVRYTTGLNYLCEFTYLKSLTINRCNYDMNVINSLNNLTDLAILSSNIDVGTLIDLKVQSLVLNSNNLINNRNVKNMNMLKSLKIVSPINYHKSDIIPDNLIKLTLIDGIMNNLNPIKDLRNLNYLHLQNMRLQHIDEISLFDSLMYVNISHNKVTDITVMSTLKYLEYLDIRGNKVMDKITSVSANELLDMGITVELILAIFEINRADFDDLLVENMKLTIEQRKIKRC